MDIMFILVILVISYINKLFVSYKYVKYIYINLTYHNYNLNIIILHKCRQFLYI